MLTNPGTFPNYKPKLKTNQELYEILGITNQHFLRKAEILRNLKPLVNTLITNLMLKVYTPNTVNRAYIWLTLVSVVIGNICAEYCTGTCQILHFSGTI